MKYKAVIVGCGSIGALKPDKFDSPSTKNVLTHAHAIYNNPDIELIGVVDQYKNVAKKAAQKWKTEAHSFASLKDNPDIVVIAVPTAQHHTVFEKVRKNFNPEIVVGEKPLGNTYTQCLAMHNNFDIPIVVHYNRRFEKEHQRLSWALQDLGNNGKVFHCRVLYGRGLMHDGCHALQLMNWWFGKIKHSYITNRVFEHGFDPSIGFSAVYERCPQVVFSPIRSRYYGIFEIDILTSIGRYLLKNNGTSLQLIPITNGDDWGNYPVLGKSKRYITTKLTTCMGDLYENVVGYLEGKEQLKCTSTDAVEVWEAYKKITGR